MTESGPLRDQKARHQEAVPVTAAERGLLLLCCGLGQRNVYPLTMAQFRELSRRAAGTGIGSRDPDAAVTEADLLRLHYSPAMAQRIVELLDREDLLQRYLAEGQRQGFFPLTRISPGYPEPLLQKKGVSRPPLFFCAGDAAALQGPYVGLAGSRDAGRAALDFAAQVGFQAAREGMTLVTGAAEGADRAAMNACLQAGGRAVAFVPDDLRRRAALAGKRCLLLSEGGYDLPFSTQRAMMRNGYIHMMGEITLIAQTGYRKGGTWNGALENLRRGWSRVYIFDDGSAGAAALIQQGAEPLTALDTLSGLT